MHDNWPAFIQLGEKDQDKQTATLNYFFPEGKTLVLTFAASKETFPETRRNFLAALASHPELKGRLLKEFWYAGEKIYEVYEIDRSPKVSQSVMSHRESRTASLRYNLRFDRLCYREQ